MDESTVGEYPVEGEEWAESRRCWMIRTGQVQDHPGSGAVV